MIRKLDASLPTQAVNDKGRYRQRPQSGIAYRVPIVHLWQIRDGLVARARFFIDHPKMFKALEPV
jgi:ketosteroid isomerase-like protein